MSGSRNLHAVVWRFAIAGKPRAAFASMRQPLPPILFLKTDFIRNAVCGALCPAGCTMDGHCRRCSPGPVGDARLRRPVRNERGGEHFGNGEAGRFPVHTQAAPAALSILAPYAVG